eukprot:866456-Rhodomonas_salina.1
MFSGTCTKMRGSLREWGRRDQSKVGSNLANSLVQYRILYLYCKEAVLRIPLRRCDLQQKLASCHGRRRSRLVVMDGQSTAAADRQAFASHAAANCTDATDDRERNDAEDADRLAS